MKPDARLHARFLGGAVRGLLDNGVTPDEVRQLVDSVIEHWDRIAAQRKLAAESPIFPTTIERGQP